MAERLTEGRTLYAAHRAYVGLVPVASNLLDPTWNLPWEELSWDEQDEWEAKADELNEARRDSYDT